MDAFDTMGLSPSFELDLAELESRYRDLQRALHPDKYVNASASERRASLSRAVSVNEAYRLLKDPLRRAEVLFVRLGGTLDERDGGRDPELLMEIMELREALGEAKSTRNLDAAIGLGRQVEAKQEAATRVLRASFDALAHEHTPAQLARAAEQLSRLRYYRRFQDEVAQLEEDLAY